MRRVLVQATSRATVARRREGGASLRPSVPAGNGAFSGGNGRAERAFASGRHVVFGTGVRSLQRKPARGQSIRSDLFERQADAAARAAARGEEQLGKCLSPAPAASYSLPSSPGEALPSSVRAPAERAFGANLAAVRIHRDHTAQGAARSERALAFTAGRDIYFAAGTYDPAGEAGRELLYHELAHVLQQTGVTSPIGVVSATAKSGGGELQLHHSGTTPLTPEALFDGVARLHQAGPRADDSLRAMVESVRTEVHGRLDASNSEERTALTSFAARDHSGDSAAARSFLYDCLKIMHLFAEAAQLLDRDTRFEIQTLRPTGEMYVDAPPGLLTRPPRGESWFAEAFTHSFLREAGRAGRRYFPDLYLDEVRRFVYQPIRSVARIASLVTTANDFDARLTNPTPTSMFPSERVLGALRLIVRLDGERVEQFGSIFDDMSRLTGRAFPEIMNDRADRVRAWAEGIRNDSAVPAYRRTVMENVERIAGEASSFWTDVLSRLREQSGRIDSLSTTALFDQDPARYRPALRSEPALVELHERVRERARELFAIDHDDTGQVMLPSSEEYQLRVDRFVDSAVGQGTRMAASARLEERLYQILTSRRPDREAALSAALALSWVAMLVSDLRRYSRAEDDRTPEFEDERIGHRILIAVGLARFGLWAGWADVMDVARSVVFAELEGTARLAIISPWQWNGDLPISAIGIDFREDRQLEGLEPLTVGHLMSFYSTQYLERMRRVLNELLRDEQRITGGPIDMQSVFARFAEAPRPKRYSAGPREGRDGIDYRYAIPRGTTPDFGNLIASSRRTEVELIRQFRVAAPYDDFIFPIADRRVFAWYLPDMRPLIQALREIPSLRDVVAAGGPVPTDDRARELAVHAVADGHAGDQCHLGDGRVDRLRRAARSLAGAGARTDGACGGSLGATSGQFTRFVGQSKSYNG